MKKWTQYQNIQRVDCTCILDVKWENLVLRPCRPIFTPDDVDGVLVDVEEFGVLSGKRYFQFLCVVSCDEGGVDANLLVL